MRTWLMWVFVFACIFALLVVKNAVWAGERAPAVRRLHHIQTIKKVENNEKTASNLA